MEQPKFIQLKRHLSKICSYEILVICIVVLYSKLCIKENQEEVLYGVLFLAYFCGVFFVWFFFFFLGKWFDFFHKTVEKHHQTVALLPSMYLKIKRSDKNWKENQISNNWKQSHYKRAWGKENKPVHGVVARNVCLHVTAYRIPACISASLVHRHRYL